MKQNGNESEISRTVKGNEIRKIILKENLKKRNGKNV